MQKAIGQPTQGQGTPGDSKKQLGAGSGSCVLASGGSSPKSLQAEMSAVSVQEEIVRLVRGRALSGGFSVSTRRAQAKIYKNVPLRPTACP